MGVTNEEEAILMAQQLDLKYSQSGVLYEIIPEALRPMHNVEKPNPRPHVDGVVGSVNYTTIESLSKKLHGLLVKQYAAKEEKDSTPSSQTAIVFAQSS